MVFKLLFFAALSATVVEKSIGASIAKLNLTRSPLILTPLLNSGDVFNAREAARVTNLPNAPDVISYAGYLTVNKTTNSNLFFWFFPAQDKNAPVAVWLQGGPGAASVFGLFTENGPFFVQPDMNLKLRKYSWTNLVSMVYIDQPAGTGFSFTDKEEGYVNDMNDVGRDLYEFLQQFFTMFPEQRANDFYLTGESYGGKYVPAIAHKLHQERSTSNINFKGMAIGDGWIDASLQSFYADLLYNIGVFNEKEAARGLEIEKQIRQLIAEGKYRECFSVSDPYMGGDRHPLTMFYNTTGSKNYFNFLQVNNAGDPFTDYLARVDVREAIHVGDHKQSDGVKVEDHLVEDICKSTKPWVEEIINAGYQVLLYNGQTDIIVAPVTTQNLIKNMTWKGSQGFQTAEKRIWKVDNDDVAGYITSYDNFHYAVVRKAGHMIPTDQPKAAYDLIRRFISGKLNLIDKN